MRKLIAVLILLMGFEFFIPQYSEGRVPVGKLLDTSSVNLDNTYAGSENEFIAGGTSNVRCIIVVNPSSVDLYGCFKSLTVGACADDMVIPANSFRSKCSDYIRGLYLRASSGSVSSGILEGTGE